MGFVEISGTQIDDVGKPLGVAQEVGPGEWAYERDLGRPQDRRDALRGGRSDPADDGEHVVPLGEPAGIRGGELRLVPVIQGEDLKRPAVDPSERIPFGEGRFDAGPVVSPEIGVRSREGGALAEHDGVGGHPRRGRRRQGSREQDEAEDRHGPPSPADRELAHRGLGHPRP